MSERTITARILVVVDDEGNYSCWDVNGPIGKVREAALMHYDGEHTALNLHTVEVELGVPEPAPEVAYGKTVTYQRRVPKAV